MRFVFKSAVICCCIAGNWTAADSGPFTFADDPPAKSAPDKVEPKPKETDEVAEEPAPPRTQWMMFTADWCPACHAARADFEAWLKRGGWKVDASPEAHVRIVDADREPDLVRKMNVRAFPTFVLLQNDRELRRTEGYPGRGELVRRFQEADQAAVKAVGAVSVGTLKGQQHNIANLIAGFRPLLGEGGALTVKLDRRGSSAAVLPLGDRITIVAGNPLSMTYTLENDVLTCKFAEPYPRGRFTFGVPVEQTVSAVSLSISEVVIELPRAPDVRLNVEP